MSSFYKHDIKFYQIDSNFYELKSLNARKKIEFIIEYHREKFKSEGAVEDGVTEMSKDGVEYVLYVFDEVERESKWKSFLPKQITVNHDFNVVSSSFALFSIIGSEIFVLIGGKGISVIQRFINHTFGIDFFEKLAEPENDIVHSITVRGVIGKLSSENRTYRSEQSLQDALSIGTVPVKVNMLLRKDLKDTIFDFIEFEDNENVYLEIGSSFSLKWKLSFEETHEFIVKMNEVLNSKGGRALSRFEKINDSEFCEDILKQSLYEHIRNDMVRLVSNDLNDFNRLDYDFIHPSKLLLFYECDNYEVYLKGGRKPILETRDRTELYYETLRYVHGIVDQEDRGEFRKVISGVQVKGFVGDQQKTKAPFITHMSCEVSVNGSPYFLIDTLWYQVRGDFISAINQECSALLKSNELTPNPLTIAWNKKALDEGAYNLKYLEKNNFLVLDKMLGQNIELCDLLYETEDSIFLIHVKEGFDAKMRDVTNQVSVSAQRLWNDIKSNYEFIESVFLRYSSSSNYRHNLTLDQFKLKFKKKINFVIAFSHSRPNLKVADNIEQFGSNIAKFSLIRSMREMQSDSFPLSVVEIENV